MSAKVLIFSGYGLNCEEETKHAFELAGAKADIVHINDLILKANLNEYQVLAFPGGFSFGDDTGSGKAYANKIKNHLLDKVQNFAEQDKLIIGICNGFQILTGIGLLPGALTYNDGAQYIDRWVDLEVKSESPWLKAIDKLSLPIAHGEGKFYSDAQVQVAFKYVSGEICNYADYASNPNGSQDAIAAVLGNQGRILGMMPHPERAIYFTQQPHWTSKRETLVRAGEDLPEFGPGLKIFENAVAYFS
jgi:phosphoribosylformylglycinamidine synthase